MGVPTEAWGLAHPSSLPFLLPLSPSLPRQKQTPFPAWPPQTHTLGWGCSPQHGQDTPSLGKRFPGIPNPSLDTRGAALGLGTPWVWGGLEEGQPFGRGNLTWEVTPQIWGGLEDEGALEEGVKVLGGGKSHLGGGGRILPPLAPSKPCQHLALGHLWGVSGAGAEVRQLSARH